jgi:hypothetical protein
MTKQPRFWICIFLAALLASFAHAGGSKTAYTFNAAVPEGWKTIDSEEPMLFMTKDGGYKQFVLIRERPLTEPFQFTKKTMRPDMMPEEAAQIIIGELLSDPNIRNCSVTENMPARIDGNSGFRLAFVYTDVDGYLFKLIFYGFIKGNTFYNIRYGATQEDYFQENLKTFESVLNSFKLTAAN